MKKIALFLCIAILGATFTYCKKYPEGPAISLRTKKERVANTWKISKYIIDDVDKTSDANNVFVNYNIMLTKSGDYSITYNYLNLFDYSETGDWEFNSNKKDLILTQTSPKNGNRTQVQILKLYEKELWIRYIDSNGTKIEIHFIPQ